MASNGDILCLHRTTNVTMPSSSFASLTVGGTTTSNLSLSVGGLPRVFVGGNGNVGVGSSNPQYNLDVVGNVNLTGNLFKNGAAVSLTNPLLPVLGTSNSYMTGLLGLGGKAQPGYPLDVQGSVNVSGDYLVNGVPLAGRTVATTVYAGGGVQITPDMSAPGLGTQLQVITGSNAQSGDAWSQGAMSVSSNCDYMIMGMGKATGNGGVQIFFRSNASSAWGLQAAFTGATGERLGTAVAMSPSGLHAVAGAPGSGRAYVLSRAGTVWTMQAPSGMVSSAANNLYGGGGVAITNSLSGSFYVAVADPAYNTVYSYFGSNNSWTATSTASVAGSNMFGGALALSGDGVVLAVGASNDVNANNDATGSVTLFVRGGGAGAGATWTNVGRVVGESAGDLFGRSVAVDAAGSNVLVGAPRNTNIMGVRAGAVYAYSRSGAVVTALGKVVGADTVSGDMLGYSVSVDSTGAWGMAGAPTESGLQNVSGGSAYTFSRSGSNWTFVSKVLPNNPATNMGFGDTVAIGTGGSNSMVGAARLTHVVPKSGGVYAFAHGTNPFFVNTASNVAAVRAGLVGVGKSNPAFQLDVAGDINFDGVLRSNGQAYVGSQWTSGSGNIFLMNSNVGIGTSNPEQALHVASNIRVDGAIMGPSNMSMWLNSAQASWGAVSVPAITWGTGGAFTVNTGASFCRQKWCANDVSLQFSITGTVGTVASSGNVLLTLPVTAVAYTSDAVVGDLTVTVGASDPVTFKGMVEMLSTSSTTVTLRVVTGTLETSIATGVTSGTQVILQGSMTYTSSSNNQALVLPSAYVPAAFVQNSNGEVVLNGGGATARGRFDIVDTGNNAALVVDKRASGNILELRSNQTRVVVVDNGGNVGIGIPNPSFPLHVAGSICVRLDTAYGTKNVVSFADLGFQGITGAKNWAIRGVYQYSNGVTTNADGGDFDIIKALNGNTILATKSDGTTLGNVGIGTISPESKLQVNGNMIVRHPVMDSRGYIEIRFNQNGPNQGSGGGLILASDEEAAFYPRAILDTWTSGVSGATPLVFRTSGNEKMRLTNTGSVGIGTSAPDAKLHVIGDIIASLGIRSGYAFSEGIAPSGTKSYSSLTAWITNPRTGYYIITARGYSSNYHTSGIMYFNGSSITLVTQWTSASMSLSGNGSSLIITNNSPIWVNIESYVLGLN